MTTQRDSAPPAPAAFEGTTFPPLSTNRNYANKWYTRLMSASAPASNDCSRFAANLEKDLSK